MFKKFDLIAIAKDFSDRMQKKNIDTCAGSTSFFLILSLIPLLILLASLLPYTSVTDDDLIQVIVELTPDFANDILIQLVNEAYSKGFSIILVFPASVLNHIRARDMKTQKSGKPLKKMRRNRTGRIVNPCISRRSSFSDTDYCDISVVQKRKRSNC